MDWFAIVEPTIHNAEASAEIARIRVNEESVANVDTAPVEMLIRRTVASNVPYKKPSEAYVRPSMFDVELITANVVVAPDEIVVLRIVTALPEQFIAVNTLVPSEAIGPLIPKDTKDGLLLSVPQPEPPPANVVTAAVEVFTARIESAVDTYKDEPTRTVPPTSLNDAAVPVPFTVAIVPLPANVDTAPRVKSVDACATAGKAWINPTHNAPATNPRTTMRRDTPIPPAPSPPPRQATSRDLARAPVVYGAKMPRPQLCWVYSFICT